MKSSYKDITSSGFEYDVRFCPKCRDMKLFHLIKGIWKCEYCEKEINKNRRRKSDENIKA